MLGKLLKYEIKSTARIFLPLYPLIIALALLNKLLFVLLKSDNIVINTARFLSVTAYVLGLGAIFVLTFIVMIQRFYKNLLKEEGYLSFTLPVTATAHIVSKLIVSCMWNIGTTIVAFISLLVVIPNYAFVTQIPDFISKANTELKDLVGISLGVLTWEAIALMFISMIMGTLMLYAAMALGHLASKNKVLLSFAAYFVLYMISQTVSTVLISIFGYNFGSFENELPPDGFINAIIFSSLGMSILMGIGYFFITKIILAKKLNIE